jgi:hypothetical protein
MVCFDDSACPKYRLLIRPVLAEGPQRHKKKPDQLPSGNASETSKQTLIRLIHVWTSVEVYHVFLNSAGNTIPFIPKNLWLNIALNGC